MAETYTVTNVIETTELTQEGRLEKMWRVQARTKAGILFTVSIPDADLSKDHIAKILAARAATLDAVKGM